MPERLCDEHSVHGRQTNVAVVERQAVTKGNLYDRRDVTDTNAQSTVGDPHSRTKYTLILFFPKALSHGFFKYQLSWCTYLIDRFFPKCNSSNT